MSRKITLIGGGSATFTPQLMRLFAGSEILRGSTIVLMDVDAYRLQVMDTLAKLIVSRAGADLKVESTTDQHEALVGADFVITSIAVGGPDAYEPDIEIPARYGIYMHVCDSVGPGGIMRALRHIPVLVSVCQGLDKVSPHAVVVNYANPLSVNTLAMQRFASVQTLGLCTCSTIPTRADYIADVTGLNAEDLVVPATAAGLNHCAAITELRFKDGRDALPMARERATEPVTKWGLATFGVIPYCWSHWTEFFPFLCRLEEEYRGRLQGLKMQYNMHVFDMEDPNCPGARARAARWAKLAEELAQGKDAEGITLDTLPQDEGVQVLQIMESLIENRNEVHIVNVTNQGAVGNLPADAIVEVPAVIGAYGIKPVHVGNLPDPLAAILRTWISVQDLIVEAALNGDRKTALRAFQQDPQVAAKLTPQETERLLDEMLRVHASYLPRFN
jgi:alpha-galactosidase